MRYDGTPSIDGHGFQVHVGPNKPKSVAARAAQGLDSKRDQIRTWIPNPFAILGPSGSGTIPSSTGACKLRIGCARCWDDNIEVHPLAVEVNENHVQTSSLDGVGAIDRHHPVPPWNVLFRGGGVTCKGLDQLGQPIADAIVPVNNSPAHLTGQAV